MKKRLVMFGSGDIAELASFYFTRDSDYEVVAFTVDASYLTTTTFGGRPVVPFEQVTDDYPPDGHEFFVALSYARLNLIRKDKYLAAKAKGYRLASYVSSRATILTEAGIGDNCLILEDNTVQPFVKIGNNVTLWSGNHVGHHSTIGDHCFVASHAVVSGGVQIGEQCFIGVNATLRDHIKVGDRCIVGAGTLLLSDAPPDGVYKGTATDRSKSPSDPHKPI